uniref:Uncharacterized protein n=1 Tax=Pyxicephalus adspersus TaxID=30357 RepID=A0AAV3AFH1_PYXAD|nr:TPA: hypothetical protein GDO54_014662 [Pyxicephalus adspersus]
MISLPPSMTCVSCLPQPDSFPLSRPNQQGYQPVKRLQSQQGVSSGPSQWGAEYRSLLLLVLLLLFVLMAFFFCDVI